MAWLPKCKPAFLLVAAVTALPLMLGSCGGKDSEQPKPVRPVKLMTLESPGLYLDLAYPATVKAIKESDLSFLVSGRLLEIRVKRGQSVKVGDVLAKLDPRDYQNEYDKALAYSLEREAYTTRVRTAFDQGAATESELDEATRNWEVSKGESAIRLKALDDTILRAPFEGEIGIQYRESFQDVEAKEKVFRLQDTTRLKIIIDVPESVRILAVKTKARQKDQPPSKQKVMFEDLPERVFEVEYYEDEQTADPLTRTYAVTFVMTAPEPNLLLPGMSATLKMRLQKTSSTDQPTFYVPVEAVFSGPGADRFVWRQDAKTQTVSKHPVKVGSMSDRNIAVLEGLDIGDTIAVSGVHHLRDGMKVRPLAFKAQRAQE